MTADLNRALERLRDPDNGVDFFMPGEFRNALEEPLAALLEAAAEELWPECQCHEAYTSRKLRDPTCLYHDQAVLREALVALVKAINGEAT